MNVAIGELAVIAFVFIAGVLPITLLVLAVVDLARRPEWQWTATEQNQVLWMFVILLICCIGPVVYLIVVRPRLNAAAATGPPPGTEPA